MKRSMNFISYKVDTDTIGKEEEKEWSRTDKEVKRILHNMGERIEASENLKERIGRQIQTLEMEKEEHSMGRFSMKKVAVGVMASCLLVGTICIAGSGIRSYIGSSSTIPDYTEYADLPKAEAEVGFELDAVERFGNGFALKGIHIGESVIQNEAGQDEEREKDIRISYEKSGDSILLHVRELFSGESEAGKLESGRYDKKLQAGDVTLYYSQFTQKSVPVDYELTEEDKAGIENGSLNVGYGTSEVELNQFYYVGWIKGGKLYEMSGFDLPVSADELMGMAKEVVESGN